MKYIKSVAAAISDVGSIVTQSPDNPEPSKGCSAIGSSLYGYIPVFNVRDEGCEFTVREEPRRFWF